MLLRYADQELLRRITLGLGKLDQELLRRITLGCGKFVSNMEDQWYGSRVKPRKPSQRQRIQLSVLYPSLTEPYNSNGFRSFPFVRSRLSASETVDTPLVCNSLKTLLNVNYYEKTTSDKHSELSSTNTIYYESEYVHALKELVSSGFSKVIIYYKLLESSILERYLAVCKYTQLLRNKHINIEEGLKARKAMNLVKEEKNIDSYKQEYLASQELLKNKSNKQIFLVAQKLAGKDLQNKPLEDETYTRFFIAGGISYGEIEHLPYEK